MQQINCFSLKAKTSSTNKHLRTKNEKNHFSQIAIDFGVNGNFMASRNHKLEKNCI